MVTNKSYRYRIKLSSYFIITFLPFTMYKPLPALTSSVGSRKPPPRQGRYSPLKEGERGFLYSSIRLFFKLELCAEEVSQNLHLS